MPTPGDAPSRRRSSEGDYHLPGPLSHDDRPLPVAPTAPRIPGALRAFNGMAPPPPPPPAIEPEPPPPRFTLSRQRPPAKEAKTIRDLLVEPATPAEEGRLAALKSALARLRRGTRDSSQG